VSADVGGYLNAKRSKFVGQSFRGLFFLERKLGMLVKVTIEGDQLVKIVGDPP